MKKMTEQATTPQDNDDDLQIEISANPDADLFAVMVTRADSRVESVVCIPHRGRTVVRKNKAINGSRPDPERFKSPIKDGRRSALGDRWRHTKSSEMGSSSGVRFIPDDFDDDVPSNNAKLKQTGQRFHLRVAYPQGFIKRRSTTLNGACSTKSVTTIKD